MLMSPLPEGYLFRVANCSPVGQSPRLLQTHLSGRAKDLLSKSGLGLAEQKVWRKFSSVLLEVMRSSVTVGAPGPVIQSRVSN